MTPAITTYIEQAVRTAFAAGHDRNAIKAMVDATIDKINAETAAGVYSDRERLTS